MRKKDRYVLYLRGLHEQVYDQFTQTNNHGMSQYFRISLLAVAFRLVWRTWRKRTTISLRSCSLFLFLDHYRIMWFHRYPFSARFYYI